MGFCEKCGTRIPEGDSYCPRCGARAGGSESPSELPCRFCQAYNRLDRVFCLGCRRRVIPLTAYDVVDSDFVCDADRETLGMLQGTEPLPHIIQGLVTGPRERSMRSWLVAHAASVKNRSRLDAVIRGCSETLGLEVLPDAFIIPFQVPNAFAFGRDDRPSLAITSAALDLMDEREMKALLGHELGHVKSKHLLYHTLAESFGNGAQLLASFYGAGLVAMPIQMLLLSWHRESETSADRAALLIVDDPGVFRSMMVKVTGGSAGARYSAGDASEVFRTHPTLGRRLAMVSEFYASSEYAKAREKVRTRLRYRKALVPACRFCGASKPVPDLYCKACGRSQS
jgi:hypothetical protein